MTVLFRLLGALDALVDGRSVDLGHIRQRCVLAVLLHDPNQPVAPEALVDRVWGDRPPRQAAATLYSYVSRLRQSLAGVEGVELIRGVGGYQLQVDPMAIDLHRFRQLAAAARATEGAAAMALFDEALALWRGEPLAGIDSAWAVRKREAALRERSAVVRDRIEAGLACGRHTELLGELSTLADELPLDEAIAAAHMVALYRSGQQAEALRRYDVIRRRLADDLGIDPGPLLREAHHQILVGETVAARPAPPPWLVVPRQLPAPPAAFAGRADELAKIDRAAAGVAEAARVVAISGSGGVGKTWLALRWAHANLPRFPDGQLYINLRGFDPTASPVPTEVALGVLLEALGVPAGALPVHIDAQAALLRSLTAGRQILVVLDNARDGDQVIPLLPGSPTCTVLLTSRRSLTGLVTSHNARPVVLDVLDEAGSRELLAGALGARRVAEAPDAVDALVRHCAGLPLALGIVAARAVVQPELPLAMLADELREASTRLDALDGGELAVSVRAALSCSRAALPEESAALFAMLGLAPGPDISLPAVASLAGASVARTRMLLRDLLRCHLVHEPDPGRYRMHDLVRLYATEVARQSPDRTRLATHRVLDHYLHSAHRASELLTPGMGELALAAPAPGVVPERVDDHRAALDWFTHERQALTAAIELAAGAGFDTHAWQVAWTLPHYLSRRGNWRRQVELYQVALAAARRLADPLAQTHLHRQLGVAYVGTREFAQAAPHLDRALELADELGDPTCRAQAHRALARLFAQQQRWAEALAHDEQSLDAYRDAGSVPGQARALNSIGWQLAHLGKHGEAEASCRRALDLFTQVDDVFGQALTLDSLGYALRHLARHDEAVTYYQRAIDLFQETDHVLFAGKAWAGLGDVHRDAGDLPAARSAWLAALRIFEERDHAAAAQLRQRLSSPDEP